MQNFVLVDLYGDGTDAVSEENQKLELAKFGTVAEPYYAILTPDENVVATFPGLTRDAAEFLGFLKKGSGIGDRGSGTSAAASSPTPAQPSGIPQIVALNGAPVSTAGKVVVVNFWATYCVPCIEEIPGFNRLNRELSSKGLVVLGISMDTDEGGLDLVRGFLKKHPMEYPVALGSEAMKQQYKLDELPVTVVFDRTGKQVRRFEGFLKEDELQAAVAQAL
jgi:thiol-disulfide isomerase/thioredoxin